MNMSLLEPFFIVLENEDYKIFWGFSIQTDHVIGTRKPDLVVVVTGVSMNILRAGNKSPVQRGSFTNSAVDLLPALDFLGGLYNFCNLVIMFSLM